MGFTELCIRRPVFATVMSLVLLLAGLMSFSRLTIREYPIDEPQVSVQTSYSGASAGIIESQVTQVLEGSLAGIEGNRHDQIDVTRKIQPHHRALPLPPSTSMQQPATCATTSGCSTSFLTRSPNR